MEELDKMEEEVVQNNANELNKEDILDAGIGTIEIKKIEAKPVTVISLEIEEVKSKDGSKSYGNKLVCMCKHPDKPEAIGISSVKYEKDNKINVSALWVNKDSEGNIQKGSALATFLEKAQAANIKALQGKVLEASTDEKGYLCFKAY